MLRPRAALLALLLALAALLPPSGEASADYSAAIQALVPGGRVISPWGVCRDGCARRHQGVDVGARRGSPAYVIAPAVVTFAGWNSLGGHSVNLRDDSGRRWYYTHFQQASRLRVGQRVGPGSVVGYVGTSGNAYGTEPHLHFQVSTPGGGWADPAVVLASYSGTGSPDPGPGPGPQPQPTPSFAVTSPPEGATVGFKHVTVTGTGAPGAKAIWDRGLLRDATTQVDESGHWSIAVELRAEGANELKFRQEDPEAPAVTHTLSFSPAAAGQVGSEDTKIGIGPFKVDLSEWAGKFILGAWKAAGGTEVEGFGNQIAAFLLTNPDLTRADGAAVDLQALVTDLLTISLSLVVIAFFFAVLRMALGGQATPQETLSQLVAVIFGLGFYRFLFRMATDASNALTYSILGSGATPSFAALLEHIEPSAGALWILFGIAALILVLFIGVIRGLGFVWLIVLFAAGPLVIPARLHPATAGWFDHWWKSVVRVLAWSVVWALEFRLLPVAVALGSTDDSAGNVAAPLLAFGILLAMAATPWVLPGPNPLQEGRMVIRNVRTTAAAAGAVASGGAGAILGAASAVRGAMSGLTSIPGGGKNTTGGRK